MTSHKLWSSSDPVLLFLKILSATKIRQACKRMCWHLWHQCRRDINSCGLNLSWEAVVCQGHGSQKYVFNHHSSYNLHVCPPLIMELNWGFETVGGGWVRDILRRGLRFYAWPATEDRDLNTLTSCTSENQKYKSANVFLHFCVLFMILRLISHLGPQVREPNIQKYSKCNLCVLVFSYFDIWE